MSDDHLYLTAEEAAAILDVSLTTLYAYVSRKNIRSVKVEGSRKRRYWAADIERLSKGERKADVEAPALGLGGRAARSPCLRTMEFTTGVSARLS